MVVCLRTTHTGAAAHSHQTHPKGMDTGRRTSPIAPRIPPRTISFRALIGDQPRCRLAGATQRRPVSLPRTARRLSHLPDAAGTGTDSFVVPGTQPRQPMGCVTSSPVTVPAQQAETKRQSVQVEPSSKLQATATSAAPAGHAAVRKSTGPAVHTSTPITEQYILKKVLGKYVLRDARWEGSVGRWQQLCRCLRCSGGGGGGRCWTPCGGKTNVMLVQRQCSAAAAVVVVARRFTCVLPLGCRGAFAVCRLATQISTKTDWAVKIINLAKLNLSTVRSQCHRLACEPVCVRVTMAGRSPTCSAAWRATRRSRCIAPLTPSLSR